jgi:hypothetical protein
VIDPVSVVLSAVMVAWLIIVVLALRDVWRTPALGDTNQLLWTILILLAPVVGTIVYFVVSRPRRADARAAGRKTTDRG